MGKTPVYSSENVPKGILVLHSCGFGDYDQKMSKSYDLLAKKELDTEVRVIEIELIKNGKKALIDLLKNKEKEKKENIYFWRETLKIE